MTLGLWETALNSEHGHARQRHRRHDVPRDRPHAWLDPRWPLIRHTPASGSYIPNYEANCKPNFQSTMNYLFQLDGVGPNASVAFSNQTLTTLLPGSLSSVTPASGDGMWASVGTAATFSTSSWHYTTNRTPSSGRASACHDALRWHPAHRRYGISHQCARSRHPSPAADAWTTWAEHHLRQHHE